MTETNKYLNTFRGWNNQKSMLLHREEGNFTFKVTNYQFHLADSLDAFLKKYIKFINAGLNDELYELVPFKREGGLPLYFDIEWESYKEFEIEPLIDFGYCFREYCNARYPKTFNFKKPLNELKSQFIFENFAVTKATREKTVGNKKCFKHSYHLILRSVNIYFESQLTMGNFVNDFINWTYASTDSDIRDRTSNLTISQITGTGVDIIPDMAVYNKRPDTYRAMRMPYAHKGKSDSILVPQGGNWSEYPEYYFISYCHPDCKLFTPKATTSQVNEVVKVSRETLSKVYLPLGDIEIPQYVITYATNIFRRYHPHARYLNSEVINDGVDYRMLFSDNTSKCLCCQRPHTSRKNDYHTHAIHYRTASNDYLYRCRNANGFAIKLSRQVGVIDTWDYDYSDYDGINFKPLSLDVIDVGGTFLGQSAKGTGKSESICEFIKGLPKTTSIMYPSFRINLCAKNYSELRGYGFSYYKDRDFNPHRAIVCLNSISKCIPQKKYDIIIIDEIYSVLESFSSPLMRDKKNEVMIIFEKYLREAKRVYCLDAHLDNGLVIKPLHCLRNPDKFVYHKNPNAHDYSDYKIYYDEYNNAESSSYQDFEKRMIHDVEVGKKIAVMCSSKNMSDKFAELFRDLFPNKRVNLYNSDTDGKVKRDDFSDTMKSWGNGEVKVIIYSPTVSAGISYNDISSDGVHKLYCFVAGGRLLPSFNTTRQMFFRVRQLLDKEIYCLMSKKLVEEICEEKDIENHLQRNLIDLKTYTLDPFLKIIGIDDDFKPIFDTESWGYKLWLETKRETYHYGSVEKIKQGIQKEFANSPSDPHYPGRGMKWIDLTRDEECLQDTQLSFDIQDIKTRIDEFKKKTLIEKYYDIEIIDEKEFNKLSDRVKQGDNPLDEIENFQYKRFIRCSQLDIDLEILQNNRLHPDSHPPEFIRDTEYNDIVERVVNAEPSTISSYKNQKNWLNSYDIESFQYTQFRNLLRYQGIFTDGEISGYLKDELKEAYNKKLDKPQLYEELNKMNYHKLGVCNKLLEYIGVDLFTDLNEVSIKVDDLKQLMKQDDYLETLTPIVTTMYGKFKNESKYKRANEMMKHHYRSSDNLWWSESRDDIISKYKFYDKFPEFTVKKWEAGYKKYRNKKDDFKKLVLDNKWCPTAWRLYRPDLYTPIDLMKLINKAVSYIGYKFGKDKEETRLHRSATKYCFYNDFENLKPIQHIGLIVNPADKMEMRDNNYKHFREPRDEIPIEDGSNPLDRGVDMT
jgi:hypothetical protein